MTRVVLIRHAACDGMNRRLNGRQPGVELTAVGCQQASALGRRLARVSLGAIVASPLERARRTAAAIAQPHGLEVETDERFVEIDFGLWTGAEFAALSGDPAWERWNRSRSLGRCPAGEAMADVQRRAIAALDHWIASARGAGLAVVSHGDVIRAILAWYLELSLDHLLRIEISPASVTLLEASTGSARVLAVNHTGELPDP